MEAAVKEEVAATGEEEEVESASKSDAANEEKEEEKKKEEEEKMELEKGQNATSGLTKSALKRKLRWERQKAKRMAKRKDESERRKAKRAAAREAGEPLPSRKQLRAAGSMAGSSSKQRVAIDCGLDAYMREAEQRKTMHQLGHCYAANRRCPAPFQLYFTGFAGLIQHLPCSYI